MENAATRSMTVIAVGALALAALSRAAAGQENEDCLSCHGEDWLVAQRDGVEVSLYVDPDRYDASVHAGLDCVMCHEDLLGVEEIPHPTDLARVDCTSCHDDDDGPVHAYRGSVHGKLAAEGDLSAPLCQDCHGSHEIMPLDGPESSISPERINESCTQCHAEGHPPGPLMSLLFPEGTDRFPDLIHGESLAEQGLLVTANCASCHGGHAVLPASDPESSVGRERVNSTCAQCHGRVEAVHRGIVAEELWASASPPICVDCHAPHASPTHWFGTLMADGECMSCHSDADLRAESDGRTMFVDAEAHARSIHGREGIACAQCHSQATPSAERSCATITDPVNCATCHAEEVSAHLGSEHGRVLAAGDPDAPSCVDCHGTHEILEHAVPPGPSAEMRDLVHSSPTFRRNVPDLCAKCHRSGGQAAERLQSSETEIVDHYSMSIHGRALTESGLTVTAICTDCHTAHSPLLASDPNSSVHGDNLVETCGQCHDGIYDQFRFSVHSTEGNPDYVAAEDGHPLPRCNDCHSSHSVVRTSLPEFQREMIGQCGECHAEITETYFDTYHGKAFTLGDSENAAKCYDCHGVHDILPASNPASRISEGNIVGTCGQCHEGAHPQFTEYLTHATHHDPERYPALFYAFWGMTILLVSVFAFFGVHVVLWLPRSWKLRQQHKAALKEAGVVEGAVTGRKQFRRFTPLQSALHLTVVISFFGLAITGMMLKFADTAWAQSVSKILGGPGTTAWIHRVCAVATFGYFAVHLWDVAQRLRKSESSVKDFFLGENSLVPKPADVREFWQTMKWFMGRGPMPNYGRWTYWEKFDYFAVFWGVGIIGSTGLALWFPVAATHVLPGWALNVATIIHSDEALLATGFIFTIHFFNTHFRPEKFPMDPVIFTGRMPVEELEAERPRLYRALVETGQLEAHLVEPATPRFSRVVWIFGMSALFLGFTLVGLIVYSLIFVP